MYRNARGASEGGVVTLLVSCSVAPVEHSDIRFVDPFRQAEEHIPAGIQRAQLPRFRRKHVAFAGLGKALRIQRNSAPSPNLTWKPTQHGPYKDESPLQSRLSIEGSNIQAKKLTSCGNLFEVPATRITQEIWDQNDGNHLYNLYIESISVSFSSILHSTPKPYMPLYNFKP